MNDLIDRQALLEDFKTGHPDFKGWAEWASCIIQSQPSAPQWIPCKEKPDTDRNVFIARGTHDNMTVCVGHYEHDYEQWYEDRNWFAKCLYDGLYWCEMPTLPEPYKDGDPE